MAENQNEEKKSECTERLFLCCKHTVNTKKEPKAAMESCAASPSVPASVGEKIIAQVN